MAARNFAIRTRVEYSRDLADLLTFLIGDCHLDRPPQVSQTHLDRYLAVLDQRGLKGSTRRRKVAAIRSFFGFLYLHEAVQVDPTRRLIPPEREHHEPRVLSQQEYQLLQLACANVPRDAAIIELLLQTGVRVSEAAQVRLLDLVMPVRLTREETGAVHIHGKGRRERTITLNYKALKAIKSCLAVRPEAPTNALFVSKFRRPITVRAIRMVVKRYMAEAGIERASVHTLRHSFATHHVRKGTNLRVVQEALGHASLETTSIYVHLARELMDKELQANAL